MSVARYQAQGPGDIVPGRGFELVNLLKARQGQLTLLELENGATFRAFNSAYGRDMGDEWEHTILNCSPTIDGEEIMLVRTSDVLRAIDPMTSAILYTRTPT
ncbi:hypothetical protein [Brevundimonas sp.]|uniref:hypothetical protein n=2 Tax=Brevundimonas sp. TaxID=1871086 RepID=UPI001AD16C2F|nr:hypothetical protein [Brevundimonas sp.]MBN9466714.1 hypothetical protein [Brevundimonas sp.]